MIELIVVGPLIAGGFFFFGYYYALSSSSAKQSSIPPGFGFKKRAKRVPKAVSEEELWRREQKTPPLDPS